LQRKELIPLISERLWPRKNLREADVWVQAVSVGEVEIASTLVASLRAERPGLRVLVTSTTPAGVALAGKRFTESVATRPFPLDLPPTVKRFFNRVAPRLLVLVETEIWPAILAEARKRRTPVAVVNARLSDRSVRFWKHAGRLLSLSALTRVAARTEEDAARFAEIGIPMERITVAGDLKLDRPLPEEPTFAGAFRALAASRPVLVAGSLAEEELDLLLAARRNLAAAGVTPFLLVAPRRPELFDAFAGRLEAGGLRLARRSRLGEARGAPDAFLLDSVGELAGTYRLGTVALLGGTFGERGGHNVLEPLRAGLPTLVGPSIWNIRASVEAAGDGCLAVADAGDVAARFLELVRDEARRSRAGSAAERLFATSSGATARTVAIVLALLDDNQRS